MKRFLLLCLLLIAAKSIYAQETTPMPEIGGEPQAVFELSNEMPLLGESFEIQIRVDAPINTEILAWPVFSEPLEILEEGEVEQEDLADRVIFRRSYQLVIWAVGSYLYPETSIQYSINGVIGSSLLPSFFIQVPSQVESPETAALRPTVPPVDLAYTSPWVFVGIGMLIIVLIMIVARLLQMSRRGMVRIVAASPLEKALAELEDLKAQNLPAATIYALVADYLRQYLQSKFEMNAVEMTTIELNEALREKNLLEKEQQRRLQQILEQADLVKFARFQPDEVSSKRLVNYAMKWLRDTEQA